MFYSVPDVLSCRPTLLLSVVYYNTVSGKMILLLLKII